MKKTSNKKLSKYYTKCLMSAVSMGAREHYDFLKNRPEIDWSMYDNGYPLIRYILEIGDIESAQKCLNSVGKFNEGEFLQSICRAAEGGSTECVKFVIDNKGLFGYKKSSYMHDINSAIRYAGENSYEDMFDYLVSIGAKPNCWHCVYWTADKGSDSMYNKLMKILGASTIPDRKKVLELCNDNRWTKIDIRKII